MAVKRERPHKGVPGELHTPDGKTARVKLPPGFVPPPGLKESTAQRPRPEEPPDPPLAPYGSA
ncbi:MAG: hypothetical protein QOG68_722 [Solirubrobacteraceae bacterium]|jgi:hypothetical protein|nr:hypothetical protein [Solirubrobacteraceae bacterium]